MKQIMIIEDDAAILEIFDIILNDKYLVTGFRNGNAVMFGAVDVPDLFIIDQRLPGYSGVEVCAYIKANGLLGQVPVLMTSAMAGVAKIARAAGADEFICKPFGIDEVRNLVDFYMDKTGLSETGVMSLEATARFS